MNSWWLTSTWKNETKLLNLIYCPKKEYKYKPLRLEIYKDRRRCVAIAMWRHHIWISYAYPQILQYHAATLSAYDDPQQHTTCKRSVCLCAQTFISNSLTHAHVPKAILHTTNIIHTRMTQLVDDGDTSLGQKPSEFFHSTWLLSWDKKQPAQFKPGRSVW